MRRELERKLLPCLDERGMTWQHGLLRQRLGRQGGGRARGPRAALVRASRGTRAVLARASRGPLSKDGKQ